jgi:hypothetical protein
MNNFKKSLAIGILSAALLVPFSPFGQDAQDNTENSPEKDMRKSTICLLNNKPKCKKEGNDCEFKPDGCPGLREWLGITKDLVSVAEDAAKILDIIDN